MILYSRFAGVIMTDVELNLYYFLLLVILALLLSIVKKPTKFLLIMSILFLILSAYFDYLLSSFYELVVVFPQPAIGFEFIFIIPLIFLFLLYLVVGFLFFEDESFQNRILELYEKHLGDNECAQSFVYFFCGMIPMAFGGFFLFTIFQIGQGYRPPTYPFMPPSPGSSIYDGLSLEATAFYHVIISYVAFRFSFFSLFSSGYLSGRELMTADASKKSGKASILLIVGSLILLLMDIIGIQLRWDFLYFFGIYFGFFIIFQILIYMSKLTKVKDYSLLIVFGYSIIFLAAVLICFENLDVVTTFQPEIFNYLSILFLLGLLIGARYGKSEEKETSIQHYDIEDFEDNI